MRLLLCIISAVCAGTVIKLGEMRLDTAAEFVGFRPQCFVGKLGDFRFQRVDGDHLAAILFEQPVVAAAKYFFEYSGNHGLCFNLETTAAQIKRGGEIPTPRDLYYQPNALSARQLQELCRIYRNTALPHFEVQVRAGGATGTPHIRNFCPA